MAQRIFNELIEERWAAGKRVCVGMDTDLGKIPEVVTVLDADQNVDVYQTMHDFNGDIMDATAATAAAWKFNIAFGEAEGDAGLRAVRQGIAYGHERYPSVPIILDYKRGDIGNTNTGYVRAAFEHFGADAVTVSPLFGAEAMKPFLDKKEKGIIVLCKTSNPRGGEFQDLWTLPVDYFDQKGPERSCMEQLEAIKADMMSLYLRVANNVAKEWNYNQNCWLVVGATYPGQAAQIRQLVGDELPFLVPGAGEQAAQVEEAVLSCANSQGTGFVVNSSRGIIYASSGDDYAMAAMDAALKLDTQIREALAKKGW
jgi:orotidine-5'-phosphate decarboxylase